jgi:proton-dependent oligopeptide transporter, POT family
VLYMAKELFSHMMQSEADARAYGIYGAYGALVYATPVIGGYLADKVIGYKKAIILGGILMALGHFALAVENIYFFYSALALLVTGNGFFKPNISSLVGQLYGKNDPKKDSAFTLFYMGINAGAFLAPLTCGTIGEMYGWHYGFGLAGVGMLIGLMVFWRGLGAFGDNGNAPKPEMLRKPAFAGIKPMPLIIIGTILMIPVIALLLNRNYYMNIILTIFAIVIITILLVVAFTSEKTDRERIFVILILMFFSTLFWAFFEQAGSSLNLFADRNVDRIILGNEVPTSNLQSVNPMFIILLAPLFSTLWVWLSKRGKEPSTPAKFAWGIIQLGIGFLVMAWGANFADAGALVPLAFLILGYLLHTTGELFLSPVGLSMITKLAPEKIVAFIMGAWFLSVAFAAHFAAIIAAFTIVPAQGLNGETASPAETLLAFTDVFFQIGLVAIGSGLLLFLLVPILKKWMHGIH